LFVEHLRDMPKRTPFVMGNPTEGMRGLADLRAAERLPVALRDTMRYVDTKWDKLLSAYTANNLDLKIIQRALELPGSLGRKLLQIHQLQHPDYNLEPAKRDDRSFAETAICGMSEEYGEAWTQTARGLRFANLICTDLTLTAIDDRDEVQTYADWLDEIRPIVVRDAISLAHTASTILTAQAAKLG
jgi:hypothetical protein